MNTIKKPIIQVLIDKKDITPFVLRGSVEHKANVIDSYAIDLDNKDNRFDRYFDETLRIIEIFLGDSSLGTEKVLRGFVESTIPMRRKNEDIFYLSGLGTSSSLQFQEVPEAQGAYSAKTAAYMVEDIFDTYVELLLKDKILSSATTYNYDPTNKRPYTIFTELCTTDQCYFFVDAFDRLTFDQIDNMRKLSIKLSDELCTRFQVVPDISNIINYFTFKGDDSVPIKVTSEDSTSQSTYYKRYYSEQDKNFADATLAQAYADEVVATYKDPQWRYELDIVPILGLKVNHKILVDHKTYRIHKLLKIHSIRRLFSPANYSITLNLENSPPSTSSIFSDYKAKFEKLMKDVQL